MITAIKNISKIFVYSFLLFVASCCIVDTGIKHSKVKIQFNSREQIKELALSGLIFDHSSYARNNKGFTLTVVLDENEIDILSKSKFKYEILVDDLIKNYNNRKKSD